MVERRVMKGADQYARERPTVPEGAVDTPIKECRPSIHSVFAARALSLARRSQNLPSKQGYLRARGALIRQSRPRSGGAGGRAIRKRSIILYC
jgi:hypothetical protein